jgi:hypothetical protein
VAHASGSGRARVGLALPLGLLLLASPALAQSDAGEPFTPLNRTVQRSELPPALLPSDLWRGQDAGTVARWIAAHDTPPASPAMHALWRRMLLSPAAPAAGQDAGRKAEDELVELRLGALYRAGLLDDIADVLGRGGTTAAMVQLWRARVDIGLGRREQGCQALAGLADAQLAKSLRAGKQLLVGYCSAVAGDTRAAALAASLAREEGSTDELALDVLGGLDGGVAERRPALPDRLSLLAYRFLELTGPVDAAQALKTAEPALLVALAGSGVPDVRTQVAAAEAALRLNALTPEAVAQVYRRLPGAAAPAGAFADPVLQRAQLFRAVEAAGVPEVKVRLVRRLLDAARRAGVHLQTARMLTPLFASLWPTPDTSTLSEAIIETALAGGELDLARRWAESAANLQHWLALIDLADPDALRLQTSSLLYLEELAARGRMSGAALHRTVTAIDALDMDVPPRLWEAAGRAGQSRRGRAPVAGVSDELAQASRRGEAGRTIVLAMRALGPDGLDGASVLALGEVVRALRQAGLVTDARRLAVEALFGVWPRTSGN